MILEVYIVGNIQPLFRHASMHTRELWNLPLQFLCEYTHNIVHYWIGVFTSSDNRTRTLCIYSWLLSTLLGCGSPGARFHIVHICLMRIFILFLTYTVEQEIDITDKYDYRILLELHQLTSYILPIISYNSWKTFSNINIIHRIRYLYFHFRYNLEECDIVTLENKDEFLLPGFIDSHIHAAQFPNAGMKYLLSIAGRVSICNLG